MNTSELESCSVFNVQRSTFDCDRKCKFVRKDISIPGGVVELVAAQPVKPALLRRRCCALSDCPFNLRVRRKVNDGMVLSRARYSLGHRRFHNSLTNRCDISLLSGTDPVALISLALLSQCYH